MKKQKAARAKRLGQLRRLAYDVGLRVAAQLIVAGARRLVGHLDDWLA